MTRYTMSLRGHEEPLTAPRWFITTPVWVSLIVLIMVVVSLFTTAFEWDRPVFFVIGALVIAFGVLIVIIMHRAYYRP
jgi:hypothetical protein